MESLLNRVPPQALREFKIANAFLKIAGRPYSGKPAAYFTREFALRGAMEMIADDLEFAAILMLQGLNDLERVERMEAEFYAGPDSPYGDCPFKELE